MDWITTNSQLTLKLLNSILGNDLGNVMMLIHGETALHLVNAAVAKLNRLLTIHILLSISLFGKTPHTFHRRSKREMRI